MANEETSAGLLPQHSALIEASAISAEVATSRGYRSVTTRAALKRLGFSDAQQLVPALLIPIHDVHGQIASYQIRPDLPRVGDRSRVVKYETPRGSRMMLDVPPMARPWLGDPARPLFLTEGARKADSAVSRGLCCISIAGVWAWRGTNDAGGKTALSDWESVALNGRKIYLAFDSDFMEKPEVHAALARLKGFLEGRGAVVSIVYLPSANGGAKVGLDDFFGAGGTVDALLSLATSDLRSTSVPASDKPDTSPYLIEDGRLCVERLTRDGPVVIPLCNFTARVAEEIALDDGVQVFRSFVVAGKLDSGRPLPSVRVPAERFSTMAWVTGQWGLHAVPRAGSTTRDQLREAIQRFSHEAGKRHVFTHTGWRIVDDRYVYLTASGGVGAEGLEVDLSTDLARYSLPSELVDPVDAFQVSLDLLDVAPYDITAPLWAAVFRAVLASAHPLDLAIWLEGITGSLKSTLLALFLSHWGCFTRTTLPGAWSSTVNLLEKRAFILKDAMFVVDDYAPTAFDRRELETKAARLLRAQGNLAGRGRLQSDLTERPTYFPRGLVVGTGEGRPVGRSILARMFPIEMDRSDVRLDLLSQLQDKASRLAHALAGYVLWLAPQMATMPALLSKTFQTARARASSYDAHLRIPEALAQLWIGLDCGLAYAEEIGACDHVRAEEIRARSWEAMVERAKVQAHLVDEEKPTLRFLKILSTLLLQRRVLVLPKENPESGVRPEVPLIGWYDENCFYLIPDAVFQAVNRFAREAGEPFEVDQARLKRELAVERLSVPEAGRTTATARIGGETHRVLRLSIPATEAALGAPMPVPSPVITTITGVAR